MGFGENYFGYLGWGETKIDGRFCASPNDGKFDI